MKKRMLWVRRVDLADTRYRKVPSGSPVDFGSENNRVMYIENDRNATQVTLNDESELLRIVERLEGCLGEKSKSSENEPDLRGVLFVDVNKNVKKYDRIRESGGDLELVHFRYEKTEESDKTLVPTGETERFRRLMCGSSHSRNGKAVFIRDELYKAVHEILLCGMGNPNGAIDYKKGIAKWNAYYALAATDSNPVTTPDKIIVIKDFKRDVETTCDVVVKGNAAAKKKEQVEYSLYNNRENYKISSMPFDGAGLVSVAMAEQWAEELGLDYIPASFQIRAIPGIKGNVFTFDIAKFAEEKNDGIYEIVDANGNRISFGKDENVVILTESQVKFISMYTDMNEWREIFDAPAEVEVNGKTIKYRRTFNISECSVKQDDVKKRRRTAYQHLQTLRIIGEDAEALVSGTIKYIDEISNSIHKFLKYRGALTDSPDDSSQEIMPPCYKAAAEYGRRLKSEGKSEREIDECLEKCFLDSYFLKKMENDIQSAKNNALAGKLFVTGNYQVFTPDLYALCEYAFGKEPNGLLKGDEIYSAWWLVREEEDGKRFKCKELAITRNPQIYMESRIVTPARGKDLNEWFEYQKTGVLISSYSHVQYALGTADFDGDDIATTNNRIFISAVKRAIDEGNGNTVYLEADPDKISELEKSKPDRVFFAECGKKGNAPSGENTNDINALMTADAIAFKNDIGTVVNLITKIWNFDENTNIERYQSPTRRESDTSPEERANGITADDLLAERSNCLKVMSVIGQLTLDAAKTGDEVVIPKEIKNFVKKHCKAGDKMPNFYRYTKNHSQTKVGGAGLVPSLTMTAVGRQVNAYLSNDRNEMRDYIETSYRDGIGYPFKYSDEVIKFIDEYEKYRDSGEIDKEYEALNALVDAALESSKPKSDFEEFKKLMYVGNVNTVGKLYKAVKAALKIAYTKHTQLTRNLGYSNPNEKGERYAMFYSTAKRALSSLFIADNSGNIIRNGFSASELNTITAGELLDCYIIAAEELAAEIKEHKNDEDSGSAPKDVLWNCFGEEITKRVKNNGRTKADDRLFAEFKTGKKPLEVTVAKSGGTKMTLDDLNTDVTFYKSDVQFIGKKVKENFGKTMWKYILPLCSTLTVITKAQNEFTLPEITRNITKLIHDYMCFPENKVESVRSNYMSERKLTTYIEALVNCGFLKEEDGRYSVKLPKHSGKLFTANTSKEADFEAYKKASTEVLYDIA